MATATRITYRDIKARHQQEFNAFPIGAAFNNKQFEEMMAKWGFTTEDTDKILSLGAGCFIRKTDADAYISMVKRQREELKKAKEDGGMEFYYSMFYHELKNHEFGYTGDDTETLEALGITEKDLSKNPIALEALKKAEAKVMEEEETNW